MDAIVCDTSSLIRLFKSGSLALIAVGFDQVFIPDAVLEECGAELRQAIAAQQFVRIESSSDIVTKYGRGERAMLNAALAWNIPNILTDDDKAAREAVRHALTPFSALDILVLAKQSGAAISIRALVDEMIAKNERIEPDDIRQALADTGEL